MEAREGGKLIPFKRMSPSMVYLKNQDEVSLAFSKVSYAVSVMIARQGAEKFVEFLRSLTKLNFSEAFSKIYGTTPEGFETTLQEALAQEKWEKTKGAMSDEVRFEGLDENALIGADVQGQVRLGDRMRQRGLNEAALLEYEKALKEEPDNALVLLKAAKTNLLLGVSDKAVLQLRRATEKNPNYGTPHVELARLVSAEEALPHLLEALAINPFDPRIHSLLAGVYEKLGRLDEAKRESAIYDLLMK
jgi:tetratricopeptide (TPR) repeat protein